MFLFKFAEFFQFAFRKKYLYYFFIADFFSVWRYLMIVLFLLVLIMIFWVLFLHCDFCEFKKKLTKRYEELEKKLNMLEDSNSGSEISKSHEPLSKQVASVIEKDQIKEETVYQERPSEEERKEGNKSIENIFFGSLFNKIGAVALVVAAGIFITFVSQFITFTPAMRVAAGFIAGLAFVFVSLNMHKKSNNMKPYAEVLLGVGLAVLFISTYCATGVFHLISTYWGLGIG